MARIVVDPNNLRNLGSAFRRETANLEGMGGRLNSAVYQLDWRVRSRYPVESNWYAARGTMRAICYQGESIASFLYYKADRLESADRSGYRGLVRIQPSSGPFRYHAFPYQLINRFLNLQEESARYCLFAIALGSPVAVGLIGLIDSMVEDGNARSGVASLCFEALQKLKPGVSAIPVIGVVVGTWLDYTEGGDYSERGLRIAASKNVIELAIGMNPYGKAALLVSAGVQVTGTAWIRGTEWLGKEYCVDPMHDMMIERSADRAKYSLEKLDLGNITGDLGSILNDTYIEPQVSAWRQAWNEPSVGNVAKAFGTTIVSSSPGTAMIPAMLNPETRGLLAQDYKSLAFHVGDFAVGTQTVPLELMRHGMTVGGTMQTEFYSRVLPPSMSRPIADGNHALLNAINSGGEIPKFEDM
jgi:hypothetical protein